MSTGYQMFCTDEEFKKFSNYSQSITSFLTGGCAEPMKGWYDKCLVFNPNEIEEINYSAGAHKCQPTGNLRIDYRETLLLHYKYLGAEHLINRYKLIRDRIGSGNKKNGFGGQYCKTDDGIVRYINAAFRTHIGFNIYREMYNDTSLAQMSYRGAKYVLDTFGRGDVISKSLLNGNVWEPRVAEKVYSLCSEPDTCYIDIGANIGTHISIAKSAGVKMIYAFECNPLTASKLASTIRINGWDDIRVFDVALSNTESLLPFTIVKDNIGASYIPTNRKEWNGPLEKSEGVKCCTFDSLELNFDLFKNIVVKMDIEGHEIYALEGMKSILKNNKLQHVILELNPFCAWIPNIELQIDLLESYGLVPDMLLFKVPGDAWSGVETSNSHYPPITKDDIMRSVERNVVMEVLFKRVKQVS